MTSSIKYVRIIFRKTNIFEALIRTRTHTHTHAHISIRKGGGEAGRVESKSKNVSFFGSFCVRTKWMISVQI